MAANVHPLSSVSAQFYIPEIVHLVILTAATGDLLTRTAVHDIVVNLLQGTAAAAGIDSEARDGTTPIRVLIEECSSDEILRVFGLKRPLATGGYVLANPESERVRIDLLEQLAKFMSKILDSTASCTGELNVDTRRSFLTIHVGFLNSWRSRWMSLVTSSAFQLSPAVQTRAFIALGVLATSDVDDDLLYQMLVAFRSALQSTDKDLSSVISMLRCIYRVVPSLPRQSRYLPYLFWLAVGLIQSSNAVVYLEAVSTLR